MTLETATSDSTTTALSSAALEVLVAAVVYESGTGGHIDELFSELAATLNKDGVRLAGAVQRRDPCLETEGCSTMSLRDIATSRTFVISAATPQNADGCTLDPQALEDVVGLVAASLDAPVDLLVINRFGKQEIGGVGFRDVIAHAVIEGIPVIVGLDAKYWDHWSAFTGNDAAILTSEQAAAWCRAAVARNQVLA